MATATAGSGLAREVGELTHVHSTPIVTTCYLDVDGAHRSRRADCLAAFGVLAQQARQRAEFGDAALRTALENNVTTLDRWLEENFDRSRTRGLVLVVCSLDSWFRVIKLPVQVEDQIVAARRPHLLQLEAILAQAKRFGVALIDHEKMRMLEYRLGELFEYPALFEGPAPHRDRQRGWNVSSSSLATGNAAARWAPAGTHVDRRAIALTERHLAKSAAALSHHLDEHPVDHLLLGGPTPERMRLERDIPDRYRSRIAGHVSVRVNASLAEVEEAIASTVHDAEKRDQEAILSEFGSAFVEGSAILGLEAVLPALSEGRVKQLLISTALPSQPGAVCTLCHALRPPQATCDVCGAPTVIVDDIVGAAVERAIISGAQYRFVRADQVATGSNGIAAITRY